MHFLYKGDDIDDEISTNSNGSFDIKFDDGERKRGVEPDKIRSLEDTKFITWMTTADNDKHFVTKLEDYVQKNLVKLPSGWISCAYRKISNQRNITERVYVSPEKEIFFSKKDVWVSLRRTSASSSVNKSKLLLDNKRERKVRTFFGDFDPTSGKSAVSKPKNEKTSPTGGSWKLPFYYHLYLIIRKILLF